MNHPAFGPAVAAYQAGRFEASAEQCRSALAEVPGDEPLTTLLAMAEHAAGRTEAAAEAFRALTRSNPKVPEYHANLGYMLRLLGRYAEAEAAFIAAMELNPKLSSTLVNYGLLLMDMARFGDARHRFLDAVEADPKSAEARIYAAVACFECGDARRTALLIPPPDTWPGLDGDLRHELAMVLIQVGRIAEAEQVLDPDAFGVADPAAVARLAMLHERTNRLDSARQLLDRIRHLVSSDNPGAKIDALTVDAALALRANDLAHARAATHELLAMKLPAPAQASAYFTLASIADKQGEPAEAMAMLSRAHAIHLGLAMEIAPEVARSDEEPLRIATKWMSPEQCRFPVHASDPSAAQSPVFIVGFPRSGTTMLEQMLDAHPAYVSMDEQPILQSCIEQMKSMGFDYPFELDRLDAGEVARIRDVYWSEVGRITSVAAGQQLVDKNPLNMLRLPIIHRLFPNAKIILALRHPCDVILSCYMQNFRSPAFMVLCSSLERLARSYANSMQSWIHHQQLLGPDVLLLKYEETVSGFEQQVARISDFLGISDRAHLVDFSAHATRKGYISTPSYSQVIQPVTTRAVARWHAYRDHFEPVFPILQPVADHWGYRLSAD